MGLTWVSARWIWMGLKSFYTFLAVESQQLNLCGDSPSSFSFFFSLHPCSGIPWDLQSTAGIFLPTPNFSFSLPSSPSCVGIKLYPKAAKFPCAKFYLEPRVTSAFMDFLTISTPTNRGVFFIIPYSIFICVSQKL